MTPTARFCSSRRDETPVSVKMSTPFCSAISPSHRVTLLRLENRGGVNGEPNNVIVWVACGFGDEGGRDGAAALLTEEKTHRFLCYLLCNRRVLSNELTKEKRSTSSFQFGRSVFNGAGSKRQPLRMWDPTISPFSNTHTEMSFCCLAASVFRRIAVANPAHPA